MTLPYYEPENEYEIQSSVMCRKEDKALCDAINKAIHEIISDGTAKKLAEQYFGEDLQVMCHFTNKMKTISEFARLF